MEPCSSMACCFDCILQSGGGSGLSAQIRALQQSWRANAPADFARVKFICGHLAAIAIDMPYALGRRNVVFVGLSKSLGPTL